MSRPMTPEQVCVGVQLPPHKRPAGYFNIVPLQDGIYRGVQFIANHLLLVTESDARYLVDMNCGFNARWPVDSDYGPLSPPQRNVRVIYTGEPSRADNVKCNPGKVFCVIGPFDDFSDKSELQSAIEMLVRGFNKAFSK